MNVTDRRQTDDRRQTTTYSEDEHEFTFAKNYHQRSTSFSLPAIRWHSLLGLCALRINTAYGKQATPSH